MHSRVVSFPADHGAVGGASHEAVQRLPGGQRMVPRTHGRGHLVACAGAAQVPQPNGPADVPEAVHPRHSALKVNLLFALRVFLLLLYAVVLQGVAF